MEAIEASQKPVSKLPVDGATHQARPSRKLPPLADYLDELNNVDVSLLGSSFKTTIDKENLSPGPSSAQETLATRPTQISTQFDPEFSNIRAQDIHDTFYSPTSGPMNSPWMDSSPRRPYDAASPAFDTSNSVSLVDRSIFSNTPTASSHSSYADGNTAEQLRELPIFNPIESMPLNLLTLPRKLVLVFTSFFFTWKDLPFPFIRKSLFVSDYLTGRSNHCSPALIRSISCLGCRVLGGRDTTQSTYTTLSNRLFNEACFLLAQGSGPAPSLPDVQAFGLLALQQLGVRRYADAIQLADEGARRMGIIVGDELKVAAGGVDPFSPSMQAEALCSAVSLAR